MEESQSGQLQLQRRPYNIKPNFSNRDMKKCLTNLYQVDLKGKLSHIYQFSFDTEPSIPQDSKDILRQTIRSIKNTLKEKISFVTDSGNIIWGTKQLSIPLSIKTQFIYQEVKHTFDVIIKPTKTLSIEDLRGKDGERMLAQVFNNKIKQILKEKKMSELSRGKYFDDKEIRVEEVGLNVIRGFKFTLCTLKSGLYLQIDCCSRVFRAMNLNQEMMINKNQAFNDSLTGNLVITNYGKRRTYSIVRICTNLNPFSKFYNDRKAGMITYAEYYKENYGITVYDKKQPLIQVVIRTQKKQGTDGKLEKKDIIGYLIPQFVSLTGMSDEQRQNFKTMKAISEFTKLDPNKRMKETDDIAGVFNDSGQISLSKPKKADGFQLKQPNVKVGGQNIVKNHQDGAMNIRAKLKNSLRFKDWVVVYSQGRNSKIDDGEADFLFNTLNSAGKDLGFVLDDPGFITTTSKVNDWKSDIQEDINKNGKPQIIVLYLNGASEERMYGELKRYITCDLKLTCQAIRRRTMTKAKNPMSAASKILIQMNQKMGGTAWEVIPECSYPYKQKTMYGAIAISKGKKGFTLAFTGTIDTSFTKVYTWCKTGYKSKDNIPQADYENMFVNWARCFVTTYKKGPQLIMVYREGLSVQQIERQVKGELAALDRVVKKIGEKTKINNYNPEIVYSTVNTKINTRIFDFKEGGDPTHSNKFTPKADNPRSGTLVLDDLSVDERFDFHLAAQRVTEGTCTPTLYTVVRKTSKISQEELAQFTYEQCFNYYNWSGAVKVPAALQCANKVAKLVGESIQADVNSGQIQTSYYFL